MKTIDAAKRRCQRSRPGRLKFIVVLGLVALVAIGDLCPPYANATQDSLSFFRSVKQIGIIVRIVHAPKAMKHPWAGTVLGMSDLESVAIVREMFEARLASPSNAQERARDDIGFEGSPADSELKRYLMLYFSITPIEPEAGAPYLLTCKATLSRIVRGDPLYEVQSFSSMPTTANIGDPINSTDPTKAYADAVRRVVPGCIEAIAVQFRTPS